jgi:hypothetical protein
VVNEIYFNQAHQPTSTRLTNSTSPHTWLASKDAQPFSGEVRSKSKNFQIECLKKKYYSVKEIRSPEMRKAASMD